MDTASRPLGTRRLSHRADEGEGICDAAQGGQGFPRAPALLLTVL